jgi:hypothetical protein
MYIQRHRRREIVRMFHTPTPPIEGYAGYIAAISMADGSETLEQHERITAIWDTTATVERFPQLPALQFLKSLDDLDEEEEDENEDIDLDEEEDEDDVDEDYEEDEDDEEDEDEDEDEEDEDGGVKPLKMA